MIERDISVSMRLSPQIGIHITKLDRYERLVNRQNVEMLSHFPHNFLM